MLSDSQIAIIRDIGQSVAFADEKQGQVDQLIIEGYVLKNGDLYELTPKGEKILTDQAAIIRDE
jgi:predicted transcriptional regulator